MKKMFVLFLFFSLTTQSHSQSYYLTWQGCFGGSDIDIAEDIIEIKSGFLIAGASKSNDGNVNSEHHGAVDGWLVKLDKQGSLIWEKCFGGTNSEVFTRIFQDTEGNFLLLGDSDSSDGDITNDPYPESTDFWIVKIDSTGNILWDRILGGGILDQVWTGTLTDDGGVVAYGWSGSTDGDVSVNYGAYDMWMVKLNGEGEKEWDFSIGTDWFDYGQAVIQTSDGGFLCGGSSAIGEGGNLTCDPFNYNAEAILVKLDKDRNIEWQQCYGGSGHDGVWSIMELEDGYLFTGLGTSADGDLTGSGYHGDGDVWVVKIDFYGNIVWQKCFGGTKYEYAPNIIQLSNNNFSIFGMTKSQDGDVIGNHSVSEYDNDIWMIKISSEGELLSQQCIGGGGDERMDFSVVKKSDYDFIIAGQTDYGPSFDVQCTPHSTLGIPDFWVFEIKDTLTSIQTKPSVGGEVKVYPNPAGDYVCFEVTGCWQAEIPEAILFNSQGVPVHNPVLYNTMGRIIWDVRNVAPGVYFYQLTNNINYSWQGKVVVN